MKAQDTLAHTTPTSRRACITAAQFNLSPSPNPDPQATREWSAALGCCALAIDALLTPGGAALITGPSGSGKTTLLRRFVEATPGPVIDAAAPRFDPLRRAPDADRPVIDLFTLPVDATMRLLAAAGLAEAPLLLLPAAHLSEGQRFRLRLGLAMADALRAHARKRRPVTIVADEFCSHLDDDTAASVAVGLARWARVRGVRIVAATPRPTLRAFLQPQLIALTSLHRAPEVFHVYRNRARAETPRDHPPADPDDARSARRAG